MKFLQILSEKNSKRYLAFTSGRIRLAAEWIVCAASGSLYATVFAGVDWSVLAWFGLLPLYWIISSASTHRAIFLAFTWGYFCSLFSFMWLREIVCVIPFFLSGVLAVFTALWGALVPFLWHNFMIPAEIRLNGSDAIAKWRSRNPFKEIAYCLALAAWWCVTEWIRSRIMTGLPWNLVGASQWKLLPLIQICRYTGVYGVSFLVVLVNFSLAFFLKQLWYAQDRKEGAIHSYSLLFSLALVWACVMSIGLKTIRNYQRNQPENEIRIGVVQPNLSQRRSGGKSPTEEAIEVCTALSYDLLKKNPQKPSLIIWPETAVPVAYNADHPLGDAYRRAVGRLSLDSGLPLLMGSIFLKANPEVRGGVEVYNSTLLIKNGGIITDIYSKIHIVPFGEYVPFGERFPFLNEWLGMGRNLTPGKAFHPIEIAPGLRAGISICYEDIFAYVSRAHVQNDANMLLVVTNDAWYPTSNEPVQHCVNSIFRAVETGLPMVRVGNCNYSVVIDPTGRITQTLFRKADGTLDPGIMKRGSGILSFRYNKNPEPTFHTRFGNIFIGGCFVYFLLICGFALLNWKIYRSAFQAALKPVPPDSGIEK